MKRGLRPPFVVAAAATGVLIAVAGRYGWHRDELYFFEAGQRLAWGYVDFPPVVAVLARMSSELFGGSLIGLRLFPALAVGGVVLLTGATAREMGGGRKAEVMGAVGAGLCPLFLGAGHLLSAATLELAAWALLVWLVVRVLAGGDDRLWVAVGVVAGVAFLAKHSAVFLVFALAVGLMVGGRRRVFAGRWLWIGAAVAGVIALPNVLWHASHDWPVFDMLRSLAEESENVDSLVFIPAQLFITSFTAVVWIPGLLWLLRDPSARPWRPIALAYLVLVVLFVATSGKPYYAAGMYPTLVAAGAVAWERRGSFKVPGAAVAVGSVGLLFALPIVPVERAADIPIEDVELEFGAQLGWERLVNEVAAAHESLPADAVVVTRSYGEAGAIDLYGPPLGLPRAFSVSNNYWLWGPPPGSADAAVVVGFSREGVDELFDECALTWRFETPHGVASEEEGAPVWRCSGLRMEWPEWWAEAKLYSA